MFNIKRVIDSVRANLLRVRAVSEEQIHATYISMIREELKDSKRRAEALRSLIENPKCFNAEKGWVMFNKEEKEEIMRKLNDFIAQAS